MAHDHGSHAHNHAAGANSRMLAIALGLTTTFLIAELIGSFVFNSLALLSDAAHMFTDSAALAIALAAVKIGQRPADDARTFGYRRFEILAAAFNALLLFAVAGYVLWEGIQRFMEPAEVQSTGMLIVAAIGLVINIIAMKLLSAGKEQSLNVKGAYLEVWADMLGSIGRDCRRCRHHADRLAVGRPAGRHRHRTLGAAANLDFAQGHNANPPGRSATRNSSRRTARGDICNSWCAGRCTTSTSGR